MLSERQLETKKEILELIDSFSYYGNYSNVKNDIGDGSITLQWLVQHFYYFLIKARDLTTDL